MDAHENNSITFEVCDDDDSFQLNWLFVKE